MIADYFSEIKIEIFQDVANFSDFSSKLGAMATSLGVSQSDISG